jgi:hypothetical protein
VSRGWINNVENGRRWPSRAWVASAEHVLEATGLTSEWEKSERERSEEAERRRLMREAKRQSRLLLSAPDALAAVVSEAVGRPLTPGDLGLVAAGPGLDTVRLPLLAEVVVQTLAGWTQLDLLVARLDVRTRATDFTAARPATIAA